MSKSKLTPKQKKSPGRISRWDELDIESQLDSVTGWAKQGNSQAEIAKMLGVGETTVRQWKKDKPAFVVALKKGRIVANGEILNSAFRQACGYYVTEEQAVKVRTGQYTEEVKIVEVEKYCQPIPVMGIFMLKNRLPKNYQDRRDIAIGGEVEHKHVYKDYTDDQLIVETKKAVLELEVIANAGSGNGSSGNGSTGKKRRNKAGMGKA